MHNWFLKVSAFLLFISLFSCSPGARVQEKPDIKSAPSDNASAAVKQSWEQEWEQTKALAKKEGTVVIFFSGGGPQTRAILIKKFYEAFGINADVVAGTGGQTVQKLKRERSAGLYDVDIYIGGPSTPLTMLKPDGIMAPLKPALLLPDLTQPELIKKVWYGGELGWVDKEKRYLLGFLSYTASDLAINTNLVKLEELKSYKDILNPKWKGKISQIDPTTTGNGGKWFQVFGSKILGLDYMRELVKQEPIIMRDPRLQAEWLVHGKAAIAIAPQSDTVKEFQKSGAPIYSYHPVEGSWLTTGAGSIVLIDRAPHPNAARLFINWLLSREGIIAFTQSGGNQSARLDVPTDFLDPTRMREPGVDYFMVESEEFILAAQEYTEIAKQMYAALIK